jgi:hypothetical protein
MGDASPLPLIKCSNCGASVYIADLGDHVCAGNALGKDPSSLSLTRRGESQSPT